MTPAAAATLKLDGSTYTAEGPYSDFVIAEQTLTPGGVFSVSGIPFSYAAVGTGVVVGKSMEAVGIGDLIMSEFGGGPACTGAFRSTKRCYGRADVGMGLGAVFFLMATLRLL